MPDYECWCLWDMDDPANIDPETLPISSDLKARLAAWEEAYDATLVRENPAASGFHSEGASKTFNEDGWKLFEELKEELPTIEIFYFDSEKAAAYHEKPSS